MSNTIYLIDANSLITPYRSYYQFTFFPTFWDKLQVIQTSTIINRVSMLKFLM